MVTMRLNVNGQERVVEADEHGYLLYVLRNQLELNGPKFGCDLAQCGACTVLADGQPIRSCLTRLSAVRDKNIVTLEGLGTLERPGPLQRAFIAEQAAQCGYCINGMIMTAQALLTRTPNPTDDDIRDALVGNLCRCGTHTRIVRAVKRAASEGSDRGNTGTLSRRQSSHGAGALAVGFSLSTSAKVVGLAAHDNTDQIPPNPSFSAEDQLELSPDLDSWIRIAADGKVTFLTGRLEVGNGILTALSQIVAEELDVPFEHVTLISADTNIVPNQGITSATTTIGTAAIATRQAAASARLALLQLASKELGADVSGLQVRDGVVSVVDKSSVKITYGELLGGRQFKQTVDVNAPLKAPADYQIVGQSIPRIDIPVKLTASPGDFQENARVPDMRFARTLRAPAYGATLKSYDKAVADMPGIVAVLPFHHPGNEGLGRVECLGTMPGDFIAVVAEQENQAITAIEQLRATAEWDLGDVLPTDDAGLFDWLVANGRSLEEQPNHEVIADEYGIRRDQAAQVLSATYRVPYQSYAPISPAWSLADVKADSATVWSATRGPFQARWMVAQALGFERDDQVQLFGGSSSGLYGRRGDYDQEVDVEAALISQAVRAPVRLQWSRQNEFVWSQYRPPQVVALEAILSDAGKVEGIQAQVWTTIRGTHPMGPTAAFACAPYDLGTMSLMGYDAGPLLRTGWMRNVFSGNSIFALESFLDELAVAAKEDPLAFRLSHTSDQRAIDVMTRATDQAGWQPRGGSGGHGMGMSFALYAPADSPSSTYMSYVAEVDVDAASGEIRVRKLTCAIDCGLVVNPNGVENQVQGGVIQALSWMLKEQVTFDETIVTSNDWDTYPILNFSEIPAIEVVIVNRTDQPSKGIGEPVTVPVAAAVANAVRDATGARLRDLPLRPAFVKAAFAKV